MTIIDELRAATVEGSRFEEAAIAGWAILREPIEEEARRRGVPLDRLRDIVRLRYAERLMAGEDVASTVDYVLAAVLGSDQRLDRPAPALDVTRWDDEAGGEAGEAGGEAGEAGGEARMMVLWF